MGLVASACAVGSLVSGPAAAAQWVYGPYSISNVAQNLPNNFYKNPGTLGLQDQYYTQAPPVASIKAAVTCPTSGWTFIGSYMDYGANDYGWRTLQTNVINGTCWHVRLRTPNHAGPYTIQGRADS